MTVRTKDFPFSESSLTIKGFENESVNGFYERGRNLLYGLPYWKRTINSYDIYHVIGRIQGTSYVKWTLVLYRRGAGASSLITNQTVSNFTSMNVLAETVSKYYPWTGVWRDPGTQATLPLTVSIYSPETPKKTTPIGILIFASIAISLLIVYMFLRAVG